MDFQYSNLHKTYNIIQYYLYPVFSYRPPKQNNAVALNAMYDDTKRHDSVGRVLLPPAGTIQCIAQMGHKNISTKFLRKKKYLHSVEIENSKKKSK